MKRDFYRDALRVLGALGIPSLAAAELTDHYRDNAWAFTCGVLATLLLFRVTPAGKASWPPPPKGDDQ